VECYSGYTYAQEPRAFVFNNKRRVVTAVRKRWREPAGPCFEVLADDATIYVLAYNEATDHWDMIRCQGCNLALERHEIAPKNTNEEDGQR